MSIISTLKKIVDPIRAREEEMAKKVQREVQEEQGAAAEPPPTYRCRVCEREESQKGYCPDCLADTMQEIGRPPAY